MNMSSCRRHNHSAELIDMLLNVGSSPRIVGLQKKSIFFPKGNVFSTKR